MLASYGQTVVGLVDGGFCRFHFRSCSVNSMIGLRSLNKTRHRYFLFSILRVSHLSHAASKTPSFQDIGVNEFVIEGMNRAFPHIKNPTPTQEQFISTILSGKDVLIQDKTGTGKYVVSCKV
jgi:hypothetical protein